MSKQTIVRRLGLILAALVLLLAVVGSLLAAAGPAPVADAAALPLAHLRQPDGTLDLTGGYAGAIDPAGWELVLDGEGRPRFEPAAATETGAWDDAYGPPGANMGFGGTGIYALAVDSQGQLYVGGNFEVIGNQRADNLAVWDGTEWRLVGQGTGNTVRALAVDGSDNLYVGGDFTQVTNGDGSTLNANRVARWDGSAWQLLGGDDTATGNGVNNSVRAIAVDGGDVYLGGSFTTAYSASGSSLTANRVVSWDGAAWQTLGSGTTSSGNGVSAQVNALAVGGGFVYAAGQFTSAYEDDVTTVSANRVAVWNPTDGSWTALGSAGGLTGNGLNAEVHALVVAPSGDLYAGGAFTTAYDGGSSVASSRLARWNGSSWSGSLITSGVNSTVNALVLNGDQLIFGGAFTRLSLDNSDANSVASFDISTETWGILGTEENGGTVSSPVRGNGVSNLGVTALLAHGGSVYLGGEEGPFRAYNSRTSGVGIDAIARWDGSAWQALGNGRTQGTNSRTIANSNISPSGVRALAVDGSGNLYVAGAFSAIGNLSANNIARWDGSSWHVLGGDSGDQGNGVDAIVYALAVDGGGNLYVGGSFRQAFSGSGGVAVAANHIARWDGAAWQPLGPGTGPTGNGVNAPVYALAVDSSDGVFVGGAFTTAYGDVPVGANRVARWDNTGWAALGGGDGATGNGVDNTVYALAASGGELFVGGQFTTAYSGGGSVAAARVARWDGGAWHPLGSGLNGTVRALLAHGGDLFAGGQFFQAGGSGANKVARWDGTAWHPLGAGSSAADNGVNGDVQALGLSADGLSLLVGGAFTIAYNDTGSSVPAGRLAAWDLTGGGWAPFGNGLDATAYTVAPFGDSIWSGGEFTVAGGGASTGVARWRTDALVADLGVAKSASAATLLVGETVTYTITVANSGPISATSTVLTDTLSLPATLNLLPQASQGNCSAALDVVWTISCALGTLAAGDTITVTYALAPNVVGTLNNTVLAGSGVADPVVGNNGAEVDITVDEPPTPTYTPTHTPTPTPTPEPSDLVLRRAVIGSAGGESGSGSHTVRGILGQSSPIGGVSGITRTVGSGYWGATLPILRLPGGGSINWEQVDLTFPPLPPGNTVWLIPQVGTVDNLDEGQAATGISFHVEVYADDGTPLTSFSEPYTVNVSYEDAQWQNAGIVDEETITLIYYDEESAAWVDTHPCAGCLLDVDGNQLVTLLDHATEFAVVGLTARDSWIFLPVTVSGP